MGAWIETQDIKNEYDRYSVAPLVGAWIETRAQALYTGVLTVAPLVGAWIETYNMNKFIKFC